MFKRTSTADDVRRVLVTALIAALEDQQKQKQSSRRGLTGMKALATGAVLFTAGRAGKRLLSERRKAVSAGREDVDE